MKRPKLIVLIGAPLLLLSALAFLPLGQFQEMRSVSPTGKETLVTLTKRAVAQNGRDNSSTSVWIEDSSGRESFGLDIKTVYFSRAIMFGRKMARWLPCS